VPLIRVLHETLAYAQDESGVVRRVRPKGAGLTLGRKSGCEAVRTWSPGAFDIYWPQSPAEVQALIEVHAGLLFEEFWAGQARQIMSGFRRLTAENRQVVASPDHEFGRERETAPGFFFGYLFHDGAKWSRSPPVRAQGTYRVLIERAWISALRETYGFKE